MNCEPDYKFPGLCAAHGSVFRGAVCEAVLIQRVRELCESSLVRVELTSMPGHTAPIPVLLVPAVLAALDGDGDD